MDPLRTDDKIASRTPTRRTFLAASAALGGSALLPGHASGVEEEKKKTLVALTFDLEMVRNFPEWEITHWDFEKGNLNEETKRYAVEAARRIKAHGGLAHLFLVGRALEQESVDWIKEIAAAGHPVGNHTYDHVNVKAGTAQDAQWRFRRSPWLVEGQSSEMVIRENIRLASAAIQSRVGVAPAGFRTPELICELVKRAGSGAAFASLDHIANSAVKAPTREAR